MGEALVYDALRTPRGRGRDGALQTITPVRLAAQALSALAERTGLAAAPADDVILGCVVATGEQGGDIARSAALAAGYGDHVPGVQISRFCSSGLDAVNLAAAQVAAGMAARIVAGGVESLSRVPMGSDRGAWQADPRESFASCYVPQGVAADLIATRAPYGRAALDAFALESQRRAAAARREGRFDRALVPVRDINGEIVLDHDEHLRPETTAESLAALPPAFARTGAEDGFDARARLRYPAVERIEHHHTAGSSSGIVDGAAAVLVGDRDTGARLGLAPRARIRAWAAVGSEPTIMLTGPAEAARRALAKAGMTADDIDLFEINEAFAAVVLHASDALGIDPARVNVNGGAIALGHPLGATGAMLLGTLVDEMQRRDAATGLVTLCVGGGMGAATVIERL